MLLNGPWRNGPPADSPFKINGANLLSKGLLFAYAGHHGIDLISGTRPVTTSVTEGTYANKRGWQFTGGAEGASDLNFGTLASTADLHEQPATWAFFAITNTNANLTALACQNDANVTAGWQVGFGNSGNIGMTLERSSTNVRASITEQPSIGVPYTLVYTSDGSVTANNMRIYLNGVLGTSFNAINGSGTTSPATAQSLYLGRRRFDTAISHNGTIFVALIANRAWTAAEAKAFHTNPYQAFLQARKLSFSTGTSNIGPLSGISNIQFSQAGNGIAALFGSGATSITFGATGTLASSLTGTATITFGASANVAKLISGASHIVFGLSGMLNAHGNIGEFEYVGCDDCTPGGPPVVINVIPASGTNIAANQSLQFDVIDSAENIRRIITYATYPHNQMVEIIHTGDTFCPKFIGSIRTPISHGYHYNVSRIGGWMDTAVTVIIDAVSDSGDED